VSRLIWSRGGAPASGAQPHASRGDAEKMRPRTDGSLSNRRTGLHTAETAMLPCFFISRRSGVSPDGENAIPTQASGLKPPTRKAKRQRYISAQRSKRLFHARAEFFDGLFPHSACGHDEQKRVHQVLGIDWKSIFPAKKTEIPICRDCSAFGKIP